MRPINRGVSPQVFTDYEDAKPFLTNRLGTYCSFCERRIPTNLAVEHILPKNPGLGFEHLRNEWANFLLSCVNCNSTKSIKVINFATYLLPDRDNTFNGFDYEETGEVVATGGGAITAMAQNTLDLVGLNPIVNAQTDDAVLFSALERTSQRVETWKIAKEVKIDYDNGEVNINAITKLAQATGFFSIWMKAFEGISPVRNALIQNFVNTANDCFDVNGVSITPRPDNATLQNSGKV